MFLFVDQVNATIPMQSRYVVDLLLDVENLRETITSRFHSERPEPHGVSGKGAILTPVRPILTKPILWFGQLLIERAEPLERSKVAILRKLQHGVERNIL